MLLPAEMRWEPSCHNSLMQSLNFIYKKCPKQEEIPFQGTSSGLQVPGTIGSALIHTHTPAHLLDVIHQLKLLKFMQKIYYTH